MKLAYQFENLRLLYPPLDLKANLKTIPDDFIVDEIMPVVMSGDGEHNWLHITKQGANTDFVAQQLARFAGVNASAVSYAGLKDRNAVTSQWFSVHLPGQADPQWQELQHDEFTINQIHRHSRKLKRGALSANRFKITLRQLEGDKKLWQQRLEMIQQYGVPNYFGLQRFGHQMNNLYRAAELIEKNKIRRLKPHKRSIFLSAMRSWIFNQIVSRRIEQDSFSKPQAGDVFMLADSQACFTEALTPALEQRLLDKDIHLTAAMWGRGELMSSESVATVERLVASEYRAFSEALEKAGMKQERRSMRLLPVNMQWQFEEDNSLVVSFELTKGSYATVVFRELANVADVSLPEFK